MREEMKNTKKLGNKGFSLIELIIVIAIMAILIGIVGTQVVPYIEKSKQAKDQQILSGLLTSATTAFASNVETYNSNEERTFIIDNNGVNPDANSSDLEKVVADFKALSNYPNGISDMKNDLKSKAGDKIDKITIKRDAAGKVTVDTHVSDTAYEKVFDVLSST